MIVTSGVMDTELSRLFVVEVTRDEVEVLTVEPVLIFSLCWVVVELI